MAEALVNKLLESFSELDRCIGATQEMLDNKPGVPDEIRRRVANYAEIVEKQRRIVSEIQTYILLENWAEVTRCIKLINGLSAMIRDDARAIMAAAPEAPRSIDLPSKENGW